MNKAFTLSILVILMAITPLSAYGQTGDRPPASGSNQLSVGPEFVGSLVLDQNIHLMLRDGTYIEGKVRQATRESLTVKIRKCEPKNSVRGPEATLATADIAVVHYKKNGSVAAPVALGVLGGFAGGLAAANIAYYSGANEGAAVGAFLLGIVGGASGGSILGREAAKKTVTINVMAGSEKAVAQAPVRALPVNNR